MKFGDAKGENIARYKTNCPDFRLVRHGEDFAKKQVASLNTGRLNEVHMGKYLELKTLSGFAINPDRTASEFHQVFSMSKNVQLAVFRMAINDLMDCYEKSDFRSTNATEDFIQQVRSVVDTGQAYDPWAMPKEDIVVRESPWGSRIGSLRSEVIDFVNNLPVNEMKIPARLPENQFVTLIGQERELSQGPGKLFAIIQGVAEEGYYRFSVRSGTHYDASNIESLHELGIVDVFYGFSGKSEQIHAALLWAVRAAA